MARPFISKSLKFVIVLCLAGAIAACGRSTPPAGNALAPSPAPRDPAIGPATAKVTIIQYGDFG